MRSLDLSLGKNCAREVVCRSSYHGKSFLNVFNRLVKKFLQCRRRPVVDRTSIRIRLCDWGSEEHLNRRYILDAKGGRASGRVEEGGERAIGEG